MYNDGYANIVNADYSTVVINQQRRKFPHMRWVVMDALATKLEDESVPAIVDKSLIDTVLCYKDRYILFDFIHIFFLSLFCNFWQPKACLDFHL